MKRIILAAVAGFLLVVWQGSGLAAEGKSSCLTCHTNDAMMKALYKPPEIKLGAAEG